MFSYLNKKETFREDVLDRSENISTKSKRLDKILGTQSFKRRD